MDVNLEAERLRRALGIQPTPRRVPLAAMSAPYLTTGGRLMAVYREAEEAARIVDALEQVKASPPVDE